MDIQNIFILIGIGWTKDEIVEDLKGEGYDHNFYFVEDQPLDELTKNVTYANEVWCFGDCSNIEMYDYARDNGLDIWVMG